MGISHVTRPSEPLAEPLRASVSAPWGVSSQTWINITSGLGISPPSRWGAASAYDPADGYDVLFGGITSSGAYLRDTWEYAGGHWTSLTPASLNGNNSPTARDGAAMSYDPFTRAIYLFGGRGTGGSTNDTWAFSGGNWTNLTGSFSVFPPRRNGAGMAFDPSLGEMLLVGGRTSNEVYRDDWAFSGTAWTNLTPVLQNNSNFPPRLDNVSLATDESDGSVVLFGGLTYSGRNYVAYGGTWKFAAGTWSQVNVSSGPSARSEAGLAWDAAGSVVLLVGGESATGSDLNDVWAYSNQSWAQVAGGVGASPSGREGAVFVPGPVASGSPDGYLLLVGGQNTRGAALSDTWVFGSAPLTSTAVSGTPPVVDVGQSTTLSVLAFGGSGSYSYQWSLPPGCVGASAPTVSCSPDQSGKFHPTVSITDGTSAPAVTGTGTIVVNLPPAILSFVATPYSVNIGTTTVSFVVTATGGTGHLQYAYSGLPYGCSTNNSAIITCVPNATGTYSVVVTVTDSAGSSTNAKTTLVVTNSTSAGSGWGRNRILEVAGGGVLVVLVVAALVYYARKRSRSPPPRRGSSSAPTAAKTEP